MVDSFTDMMNNFGSTPIQGGRQSQESIELLNALRRKAPGGADWLKGTKYEEETKNDVAHQNRVKLYKEARDLDRRADRLEAQSQQMHQQYLDAFGL